MSERNGASRHVVVVNNFAINHPLDELNRFRGKFVAWSTDGRKVLASATSIPDLYDETIRLGLAPDGFVSDYVVDPAVDLSQGQL